MLANIKIVESIKALIENNNYETTKVSAITMKLLIFWFERDRHSCGSKMKRHARRHTGLSVSWVNL